MQRINRWQPALLALVLIFLAVTPSLATNSDYEKSVLKSRQMAEELRSYDVSGRLIMENNVRGQSGGMKMEMSVVGAAVWPDRLYGSQEGQMFAMHLGTGPGGSWFYLGQMGSCYQGEPLKLQRNYETAGQLELVPDRIFDFYTGLGQYLLASDLELLPETGSEVLVVDGREIRCQVFTTPIGTGPGVIERRLWFDPESGLVLKSRTVVAAQRNGVDIEQVLTANLERFELDGEIAEERFTYTPPTGAKVVDSFDRLTNPDAMTGQPAPDISFKDFEGNVIRLADFRGKVVFLDFWATWCGPCKMEMPHIQTLYQELGTSGEVVFIGASNENQATIQNFLEKNPYTFKIVTVSQEESHGKYKVSSIPAGFVIDRDGIIRAHMIGAQSEAQLRAALAKAGIDH